MSDTERQATVRKDRYRDRDGVEFIQYTIKYEDGSGEFVRIPALPPQDTTKELA